MIGRLKKILQQVQISNDMSDARKEYVDRSLTNYYLAVGSEHLDVAEYILMEMEEVLFTPPGAEEAG